MAFLTQTLPGLAAAGPEWDALLEAGPDVQMTRAWMEATEAAALPPGAQPRIVTLRHAGHPAALLPLQATPSGPATSLTSPYTILYQPLLASNVDPHDAARALAPALRPWPVLILEALDPTWPGLDPFLAGLRATGLATARFDHFGNWHEPVAALTWPTYLAARPGPLRETLRRRTRAASRDGTLRTEIVDSPHGIEAALAAYESVYARSWKVPEPYPAFNVTLLPRLATGGTLRMGILWRGQTPIAAQYWTLRHGIATVHKLAHDDAHKALSPGTLLTAHMIRTLMDTPGLHTLDFGRGDDPYKQQWATLRRARIGVLVANPRHPRGLLALARHHAGTLRRRLRPPRDNAPAAAHIPPTPRGDPAP